MHTLNFVPLAYKNATSTLVLNDFKQAVQEIIQLVQQQFVPLNNTQQNTKLNPEKWSIAECFEHLNIYCRYYNTAMQQQLTKAKGSKAQSMPKFSSGFLGKFSIKGIHPSNRKPQKTLARFNPAQSVIKGTPIQEFLTHQQQLLQIIEQSQTKNLYKIGVPIEFFKWLSLSLGDCIHFVIAHQQRHIQQAQEVLTQL